MRDMIGFGYGIAAGVMSVALFQTDVRLALVGAGVAGVVAACQYIIEASDGGAQTMAGREEPPTLRERVGTLENRSDALSRKIESKTDDLRDDIEELRETVEGDEEGDA